MDFDRLAKQSCEQQKITSVLSVLSQHKQITCKFSDKMYSCSTKFDHVSLPNLYKPSLTREKYSSFHNHTLLMSLLSGNTYICEKFFSRMRCTESKISAKICKKHIESSLRIAAIATEPDWDISFTKTKSHTPLVLWFCCLIFYALIFLKIKIMFCHLHMLSMWYILWGLLQK